VKIHTMAQRSDAWFQIRAGKLTASVAKDILATVKSGEAASRKNLRYRLVAERLTGIPQRSDYQNAAMTWGEAHEAEAIAAYEAETGTLVQSVGFVEHDELAAGCSPDGFVGDDGAISVKCPETATHCGYLRTQAEPKEHEAQNTHELWLTGRKWIDFVSYDPRLPERLRLVIIRVTRTPELLQAYELAARLFLTEVEREVEELRKRMKPALRVPTDAQVAFVCGGK
jgi:hypothetical protein